MNFEEILYNTWTSYLNWLVFWCSIASELLQRIFQYDHIYNNNLSPDKELNILIYGSHSYIIICWNHRRPKMMVQLLAHPVLRNVALHWLRGAKRNHGLVGGDRKNPTWVMKGAAAERAIIAMIKRTRCSAIAERPRCRVRYSFRQR